MLPNRRTSPVSARRQWLPRDGSAGPESGQALAELAIVVTIILVMALAVFDLGLGFYNAMLLNQGARDGARVAIDCSTSIGQIQSAALAAAPPGAAVTVAPNPRPACPASNSSDVQTTVTVSYTHQWITPFWGGANSTTITQSAAAR
jgi:Flp pilus assembly protein TadG